MHRNRTLSRFEKCQQYDFNGLRCSALMFITMTRTTRKVVADVMRCGFGSWGFARFCERQIHGLTLPPIAD